MLFVIIVSVMILPKPNDQEEADTIFQGKDKKDDSLLSSSEKLH